MSIAKVTEVIAYSEKSFDDAIEKGVKRACKTIENVSGVWVKDQSMSVKNGKIKSYSVNLKITFILKD